MLQEFRKEVHNLNILEDKPGDGVSIYFICEDALSFYNETVSRGIQASEPFVGNNMWVVWLSDPDGYKIFSESYTNAPEETKYSEWKTEDSKIGK